MRIANNAQEQQTVATAKRCETAVAGEVDSEVTESTGIVAGDAGRMLAAKYAVATEPAVNTNTNHLIAMPPRCMVSLPAKHGVLGGRERHFPHPQAANSRTSGRIVSKNTDKPLRRLAIFQSRLPRLCVSFLGWFAARLHLLPRFYRSTIGSSIDPLRGTRSSNSRKAVIPWFLDTPLGSSISPFLAALS